jgi:circadian clock protein KaiC
MRKTTNRTTSPASLEKALTGIYGLDDITGGGLPKNRPALICGGAGSGKTMFAMEFLVRGALEYGEPGVFMSFEETEPELIKNFASLGYNLKEMETEGKISIDYVAVNRAEIEETGEYDLEGLFVRLNYAIDCVKAKRVVLDTLEALFGGLSDTGVLRAELRRLFQWLKDKGVTAIITAERGKDGITRHGIEEYVSDCVILLDNRVVNELTTRRLRILKYRGSAHGTNEYPFTIDAQGITILPSSSMRLEHEAPKDKVSSGITQLDAMLAGGYFRGSSILITGMAGAGKTSLGAHFAEAATKRRERAMYFSSEESPRQIIRNMRSIGIDLEPGLKKGMLEFHSTRPAMQGLETHLLTMQRQIDAFKPSVVVIDAVTDFEDLGTNLEVKGMVNRLVDFLKSKEITAIFTGLVSGTNIEASGVGVSSTMDSWLHLQNIQDNLERNRALYLIKSRGAAHSNQVREFHLTNHGVKLTDIYVGDGRAYMGAARTIQEANDKAKAMQQAQEIKRKQDEIESRRRLLEARITSIKEEFKTEESNLQIALKNSQATLKEAVNEQKIMTERRKGDGVREKNNSVKFQIP